MKKIDIKFYCIKLLVLLLINGILFAASLLLNKILSVLNISGLSPEENLYLARCIIAAFAHVAFVAYIMKNIISIRLPENPQSTFTFLRKEETVYFLFLLPLLLTTFIIGSGNFIANPLCFFYMPHMLFYYLTKSPLLGGLLILILYFGEIALAYRLCVRRQASLSPLN